MDDSSTSGPQPDDVTKPVTPVSRRAGGSRFEPGRILADRYRIVAPLGRGGMGEVFRADDLKLGQSVALKFLPPELSVSERQVELLLDEVRTARQVAHPNVCRVYDAGETDGVHFVAMEYIDGEDLASLLRRIGRLPPEKAIEIARQLCAGLGAVHAEGILHRDLKPANIMLDGRGRVRITDFGLASIAERLEGAHAGSGTPAYMAPEQIAGREVTRRSDVYALGLVLYELFTGKRVFSGSTLHDRRTLQEDSSLSRPSMHVDDMDPAVERTILSCLEDDPDVRPASAIAVAAALPGGDPLAAALAAGELPSPSLVASATTVGALSRVRASVLAILVAIGSVVAIWIGNETRVPGYTPPEDPPAALKVRAKDIAERFGYDYGFRNEVVGLTYSYSYFRWIDGRSNAVDRWDRVDEFPYGVLGWFRGMPGRATVRRFDGRIYADQPAPNFGDVFIQVSSTGRLQYFRGLRGGWDDHNPRPDPPFDWALAFEEAGYDIERFDEVEAQHRDLWIIADERFAWISRDPYPGLDDAVLRIEAASLFGNPVLFRVFPPRESERDEPNQEAVDADEQQRQTERAIGRRIGERIGEVTAEGLLIAIVVIAMIQAWRNYRAGRGDRAGGLRGAAFVTACSMLHWLLTADHQSTLRTEWSMFNVGLAGAVHKGLIFFAVYLALEPAIRKHWPRLIVSWARLVQGRWRDALVGRDILIGVACGLGLRFGDVIFWCATVLQGKPLPPPTTPHADSMLSWPHALGDAASISVEWIQAALFGTFLLVFMRIVARRAWLAFVLSVLIGGAACTQVYQGSGIELQISMAFLLALAFISTVARFGMLTLVVAFVINAIGMDFALTFELGAWWAVGTLVFLGLVGGLTAYGVWASTQGQAN